MKLTIRLTGTRPMLQHNGRLSNPIDPYTRELKALTGKRKKTDEDLVAIMRAEARGGCWETADGLLGVPTAAVWKAIYDAAKAFKRGEDIKRALMFEDNTEPIEIDGATIRCDDWLSEPDHIDYRSVKNPGSRGRVMRARPLITNWATVHSFELFEDVIDPRDMAPILERAGRLGGLGDWRPTYGTFLVEVL